MNLPQVSNLDVSGNKVLLRMDLDVADDLTRVENGINTLKYLLEKKAKIIIIGHKGRPDGKVDPSLSLKPVTDKLDTLINKEVAFSDSYELPDSEVTLLENLRFNPGEESNDLNFSKKLAALANCYINEAFAVSHREHASIVGLPKLLPHAAGFRFIEEVENLSKVIDSPKHPVVFLVSGIKKDKLEMIKRLEGVADKILVGGRLPEYMGDNTVSIRSLKEDQKLVVANLIMDKEDITVHSIDRFKKEIKEAGTIVLAGVLGKYEEEGHRQGTKEVFESVAASSAFKVAGGGDTEAALTMFNLTGKFDWISVGGGAMLEFFVKKTLPGIEALK